MHAPLDLSSIPPLRRLEYDKLVHDGVFERDRVELVRGKVVRMTPIGEPHNAAVQNLMELLVIGVRGRARVRCQGSFAASDDSQPEPDLMIHEPKPARVRPSRALLIAEVADSSLAYDRTVKLELYADAKVPEYWIVNLVDRVIEVYRAPVKRQYTTSSVHARGDSIALLQFPDVTIRVSDVIR